MPSAGVVFETDPNLSFVAGLARWISPPATPEEAPAPAPVEGEEPAEPEIIPSEFESTCVVLDQKNEVGPLSAKLLEGLKKLWAESTDEDIECAYTVYLQLLVKWELLPEKLEGLADQYGESTTQRPKLRCALLLSLFTLVQQYNLAQFRFSLLQRLISYCASTSQLTSIFSPKAADRSALIEHWVNEWGLTEGQQKELWGSMLDAYAEDSSTAYEYSLKYLALNAGSSLEDAQLRGRLVSSVLLVIRSSSLFQCDELVQLEIVKQMSKVPELSSLHRLLEIVARENYSAYATFCGDKCATELMTVHSIDQEALGKKLRLLTIASLGHDQKELPYKTIAAELQIENGVEAWVMEAIGNGLVTARMDQVNETVFVSVCMEREFGAKQWERLHQSLGEWRDSVRGLLQVIQNSRPVPAA